jgi:hypothetical protein
MRFKYSYNEPWWIPVPIRVLQIGHVYTIASIVVNEHFRIPTKYPETIRSQYLYIESAELFSLRNAGEPWDECWSIIEKHSKESRTARILL